MAGQKQKIDEGAVCQRSITGPGCARLSTRVGGYVPGVGRVVQVVVTGTYYRGWGLALGGSWMALCWYWLSLGTRAGQLAPDESQDPARVSPTFRPVRVEIHGWGGPA